MTNSGRWQFWIDRGGTFTDCIGKRPGTEQFVVRKVLSSAQAPLEAIRSVLGLPERAPIPACDIRMGTTVATNALLERKGTPHALAITRGFRDLLRIGTQARPQLFAIDIPEPVTLYDQVIELDARASSDGQILERPNPSHLATELSQLLTLGIDTLAVVVLHGYRCPELEDEIANLARRLGFRHVYTSHDSAGTLGLLGRADTTSVDAYLTPLLHEYFSALLSQLPGSTLRLMQSAGGLITPQHFRGPNAILSGPAGGVVAYAKVAESLGYRRSIGFDMGGTSTDVSRFDGEFERVYESEVAGVRVVAPMMSIHTVAAGGGSLCIYDGYRFRVGPESAGADPGPLCYGHPSARELAVTDLNLILGRLRPDRFPFPLDQTRAEQRLEQIAAQLQAKSIRQSAEQIAAGFLDVANDNMAQAINKVSVARGYDVREHALVVFGGAGGQHACAVARQLGMTTIVLHPLAGVLSAYGMGLAQLGADRQLDAARKQLTPSAIAGFDEAFRDLERRATAQLADVRTPLTHERFVDLRYRGTETSLTLPLGNAATLEHAFTTKHRQLFGYARDGHVIEMVALRVEVRTAMTNLPAVEPRLDTPIAFDAQRFERVYHRGEWDERVPTLDREELRPGQRLTGPALILEETGSIFLEADFELNVLEGGVLVAERRHRPSALTAPGRSGPHLEPDPVLLELMGNRFMTIAEQMGHVLQRTALSTNIRERLDFSCAVFDARGRLIANAPHIPVHLGAMEESIRALLRLHPKPSPGDVFVSNDPNLGGSHLPDITVINPIHDTQGHLTMIVANRGHHEDVGGITPGSMPPFSQDIAQEGVVFRAIKAVHQGQLQRQALLAVLTASPYPARAPEKNLADLEAQIAACRLGVKLLAGLCEELGGDEVARYMGHLRAQAREQILAKIEALFPASSDPLQFTDSLDDGAPIAVTVSKTTTGLCIDFNGTGAQLRSNLNAPRAVSVAATLYVLRLLIGSQIPLNSGCLEPIELRLPEGSLLNPGPNAAVAGGNVETSQRIVDVLLGAFGVAAASQGTMNNLSLGNARFGYYETIGGGAGASPRHPGRSGVHTHMTNTRITDVEVLESRFPLRVWQFSLRPGSGGRGRQRGGDGLIREFEFLEDLTVSLLSERRLRAPFGLAGGGAGALGVNLLNGHRVAGKFSIAVTAGDRLRIETPGGGGYGAADGSSAPSAGSGDGAADASAPSAG